ncbi:coiled-coil domain-containing protein 120 [Polymixia lowei]
MTELQERRRCLQALLSSRLAELRRICLQEAELTGEVPNDYPLEAGEKPPYVRRRVGTSCYRPKNSAKGEEEEAAQRSKIKKTLFSSALRRNVDSENTHSHTHKRTVHRGCHTDDTVRSESSSTSDSTGYDNDERAVSHCRPLLLSVGIADGGVYYEIKTRRNSLASSNNSPSRSLPRSMSNLEGRSVPATPLLSRNGPITAHIRNEHSEPLPHPPPLPPHSHSSSSSTPSEQGGEGGVRVGEGGVSVNAAQRSNSSDALLDRTNSSEEEGGSGLGQGGLKVNGIPSSRGAITLGPYQNSETPADRRSGGRGGGRGGRGGYSEVLMDYVWGKQQKMQLQRQQSHGNPRQPIISQHAMLCNGYLLHQPQGQGQNPLPPPAYPALMLRDQPGEARRVKVTRTKSCGPFLQQNQTDLYPDTHPHHHPSIQPDPHPHLQPPRPPQQPPAQDNHLEEATRSLHKALALEGLRDWYLRNTLGSTHQNQMNGKVNRGVKGQDNGGGALQRRRTTHGVIQQSASQMETHHLYVPPPPHKQTQLPHSATFHGHPLHGRPQLDPSHTLSGHTVEQLDTAVHCLATRWSNYILQYTVWPHGGATRYCRSASYLTPLELKDR